MQINNEILDTLKEVYIKTIGQKVLLSEVKDKKEYGEIVGLFITMGCGEIKVEANVSRDFKEMLLIGQLSEGV